MKYIRAQYRRDFLRNINSSIPKNLYSIHNEMYFYYPWAMKIVMAIAERKKYSFQYNFSNQTLCTLLKFTIYISDDWRNILNPFLFAFNAFLTLDFPFKINVNYFDMLQ